MADAVAKRLPPSQRDRKSDADFIRALRECLGLGPLPNLPGNDDERDAEGRTKWDRVPEERRERMRARKRARRAQLKLEKSA
jgi:hypothetical protein